MDASLFCTDVGVRLGLAEVHSDRAHGAGEPWGGAEARSKRREREKDNEVEVNDITVRFKGDGRTEEEGGARRKGARRR